MKFPVIAAATVAALGSTSFAAAEESTDNTIIVTASRSAQTVDDALASVTVITAEDIANSQALSVEEVLEGVAGIDLTNSGGYGKITSLYMRGTESDHVAVLIDGVRIGSATSGTTPWADIPLSQIERIEIVRGPRSSLYGSDAIGGVIQIFTRKAEGNRSAASVGAGNHGTRRVCANVSSQNGVAWHNVSLERFSTEGFNATDDNFYAPEADNDPYVRNSVNVRGGVAVKDAASFEVNAQYNEGTSHYDGSVFFPNVADFDQQLYGTAITMKTGGASQLKLQASRAMDNSTNYRIDGSVTPDTYNTQRDQMLIQSDLDFGRGGLVVVGIDYLDESVDSSTDYARDTRYNSGGFLQYSAGTKLVDAQASVRRDRNEWYEAQTTGNLSVAAKLAPVTVIAGYGTGYRAPTFNDLFWNDPATATYFVGNPDLLPETSHSSELGIRGNHALLSWELNAYRTSIEDLIAYSFPTVVNINKAEIKGAEARVSSRIGGLHIAANYTWLDPRDADTDKVLPRRSRTMGKLDLSWKGGMGTVGLDTNYHGKRYNDAANTVALDPYTVSNLYWNLALSDSWSLRTRIDNLFNREYQTVDTYNQAGRTAFISLQYE
ncbi:MAG: TonB-dependent receptor [Gammaproteobacteria bacterium]|nr:TonB-dependent receptor [Gammaproteobacteria bacterium]